jgi:alpha-amylase
MFGWDYEQVSNECEALGKMGWMGVKVYPPQEAVESYEWPQQGELNPWYFMYQPVSYHLHSRQGTRQQLRDMI